jgi:hypothetical protein
MLRRLRAVHGAGLQAVGAERSLQNIVTAPKKG